MSQMKDWWYLICDCLFDIAIPYKYISIWNGMYCVPVICKLMFLIKYNWHLANKAHTTFIDVLWLMGERARENNNNNKRMGTFVYDQAIENKWDRKSDKSNIYWEQSQWIEKKQVRTMQLARIFACPISLFLSYIFSIFCFSERIFQSNHNEWMRKWGVLMISKWYVKNH